MLISWKYRDRKSFFLSFDPRGRMIFMLGVTFAVYFVWDLRWVLPIFGLAIVQFLLAKISFRESRYFWIAIGVLAVFLSIISALTGSQLTRMLPGDLHNIYEGSTFRLLFWDVTPTFSAEQLVFVSTQVIRIITFALLSIVIPFTLNPALYGVVFKGLGLPYKIAYAMDLSFRLVPSTGRDFSIIVDAQRARGFELDTFKGGIVEKVRRMTPLVVPLVIGAIINGYDIADAMDLRAFGAGDRSWLPKLTYRLRDYLLIAFTAGMLILAFWGRVFFNAGVVWVPQMLLDLAL